ncbi:DUF4625 domain-containing protein [Myroides sp. BIT-d1]|uniref:DUF4625 domain-containing protein n=1 Tax=Myroides albus TaxID=2562892 RepID=A0A6I3LGU0_9FLAO|nr:DUF4625 domain-containing protein [Myroides albus]MTG96776.1 DUF4625 domain-containing protein [Myroides albus]
MKTIKYIAFSFVLSSAFLTSCTAGDDNVDTEPPVVILNAPAEGAKLEAGKDIHFDMDLSDNEALGSYNVDIHNNFDGHNHGGGNHTHSLTVLHDDHDHDHDEENEGRTPFRFNRTWDDIYGKKNDHIHHHEIVIDKDAKRGKYHFVVKVVDKAGNQSMVFRNIEIVDPGNGSGHDHDHDHDHNH